MQSDDFSKGMVNTDCAKTCCTLSLHVVDVPTGSEIGRLVRCVQVALDRAN